MSLIEKDNLNYLSTVEQFFLSLKDSGLCLSATDYHLIGEWEERSVPLERLCRAIKQGFLKSHGHTRPISLTFLKDSIEQEIQNSPS
ncbi:MAG: hypothetical protein VYC17_02975 [Nitrospinota bacterium]|nr:hypothetical protein [Nitrospinota bacterium]